MTTIITKLDIQQDVTDEQFQIFQDAIKELVETFVDFVYDSNSEDKHCCCCKKEKINEDELDLDSLEIPKKVHIY
jgi:hypothetical protein